MALAAGTRLGGYEITGTLGAGGMGEVYRATDTTLGREVAIKTLPSALAQDSARLARFEREAKLLAALNHAHIAAIYGLDEHEGTRYLAMELVEGETLEEKLKSGPFPVEDALHLALQIAEALEAAHEKGVVHRDLKPANIMVTGNGQVKVLDFGLAKAFSGDPNEASPAHSPALSMAMTQQGLILGTAGYMSPEQASGQVTDQRADIWAFGVVLYEMLTGLPLFSGESVPHILADVLRAEPDWSRLPKNLHPLLKHVLKRCLRKKVRNRYHSIADVRVDIEEILSDPQGAVVREADVQAAVPVGSRAVGFVAAVVVTGVVATLATGFVMWTLTRPAAPALERFDITPEGGLTVTEESPSAVVSPDGKSIAYLVGGTSTSGALELRLRRLDRLGSTTLVVADNSDPVASPFFSPDGTQIGFYTVTDNLLKRVSIRGGPAATITKLPAGMRGASWGTDGTIIYGTADTASGLWRVRAAGGTPEMLTKPDPKSGVVNHWWPEILPGGKGVYATEASLAANGTLVYVSGNQTTPARRLVWVDTEGHETSVPTPPRPYDQVVLSPDGTHAAVGIVGDKSVWIADLKRGTLERLPADLGDQDPSVLFFSTDGQRVASSAVRDGRQAVVWQAVDGTDPAKPLVTFDASVNGLAAGALSPDGKRFVSTVARQSPDLGVATVGDPKSYRDFLAAPKAEGCPAISPDGRWIAYCSNDTGGPPQVYVQRFPEGGGRLAVSIKSGVYPHWSVDGNALTYVRVDGVTPVSTMRVPVTGLEGSKGAPTFGEPKELFPWKYLFVADAKAHFDMTADGQRFLMITANPQSERAAQLVLVQNWFQELKRLVPTK